MKFSTEIYDTFLAVCRDKDLTDNEIGQQMCLMTMSLLINQSETDTSPSAVFNTVFGEVELVVVTTPEILQKLRDSRGSSAPTAE